MRKSSGLPPDGLGRQHRRRVRRHHVEADGVDQRHVARPRLGVARVGRQHVVGLAGDVEIVAPGRERGFAHRLAHARERARAGQHHAPARDRRLERGAIVERRHQHLGLRRAERRRQRRQLAVIATGDGEAAPCAAPAPRTPGAR